MARTTHSIHTQYRTREILRDIYERRAYGRPRVTANIVARNFRDQSFPGELIRAKLVRINRKGELTITAAGTRCLRYW